MHYCFLLYSRKSTIYCNLGEVVAPLINEHIATDDYHQSVHCILVSYLGKHTRFLA